MSEVVYISKVHIDRIAGPARLAYLPAEPEPVHFGVHGAIAEHYGVSPEKMVSPMQPRSITLWPRLEVDSSAPSGARWRRVR